MTTDYCIQQQFIAHWKVTRLCEFALTDGGKDSINDAVHAKVFRLQRCDSYPNGPPKYSEEEMELIGEMYAHLIENEGKNDGQEGNEEKRTQPGAKRA